MPQEAEAGNRFARDMRRIREAHHLSVGDLHDETKIPMSLIQAFEETGLFDHPQFNRVYLRSFVRTYANVIGVEAEDALEALEDALSGSYTGSLAASYLDEKVSEAPVEEEDKPAEQEPSTEEPEAAGPKASEKTGEEREPPIVSTTSEAAASYEEPEPEEEEPEEAPVEDEEVDKDWAAQSPPSAIPAAGLAAGSAAASRSGDRSRHRRDRDRDRGGLDRRWVLAGGMVVIVAVVVWILISVLGDGDSQTAQPVAAADTVQTQDTTQAQQQPAQTVNIPAIGDTMDVQIIAAQGKVDPIRVTVDDDLRRP